ncbi:hypothetical protein QVN85_11635 [Oscillibacter valericigenes]|nr:hypothetical protein [Oscillibacter valericigenes]
MAPTYFWGLPSIVCDFLGQLALSFEETPYVYHVLTFGSSTGSHTGTWRSCWRQKD